MGWIARCVMMNHELWFSVHHAPTQSCTTLTIFSKILTYPLIFFIVLFASVLFPPNNKTVQWSRLLHVDKRRLRLQRRLRAVLEVSKQGTPCIYTERLQLQSHFLCKQYYINKSSNLSIIIFLILFGFGTTSTIPACGCSYEFVFNICRNTLVWNDQTCYSGAGICEVRSH